VQKYVDWVYAHFGADRMMLASNWPVIELRSGYRRARLGRFTARGPGDRNVRGRTE
jgi:predicted TIM-barrel fold metal-dependent hydrolase